MGDILDWESGKGYPQGSKVQLRRWAWEFLRRNPEYIKEYDSIIRPYGNDVDRNNANVAGFLNKWHMISPADPSHSDIRRPGLSVRLAYPDFANEWWTREFSPQFDNPGVPNGYCLAGPLDENEMLYRFDLRRPLAAQIRLAQERLEEIQSRLRKSHNLEIVDIRRKTDKYNMYLRILDARDMGVEISHIARVLFPLLSNEHPDYNANRQVRDAFDAAKKLRDHNWFLIIQ